MNIITTVYQLLWGDLIYIPLPGGQNMGLSLLVLILIPAGIFFTIRTRFLPLRLFPEMLRVTAEKRSQENGHAISGLKTTIISFDIDETGVRPVITTHCYTYPILIDPICESGTCFRCPFKP